MGKYFAPISKDRYQQLLEIEATAKAYVEAINKEMLPVDCCTWADAEEQTLEALHVALGFRD